MEKFNNIEYLKRGSIRQQRAYSVLKQLGIMDKLQAYDPILVGTIPIGIDIEDSDLDVICYYIDKQDFANKITTCFKNEKDFKIRFQETDDISVVANFFTEGFEIEIFGQNIPTKQQYAYRHMIIEYRILSERGEMFRKQIIELKQQGLKTEPAFGRLLGLKGNPYEELLSYEV
ncbi:hypothetical protein M2132_000288 [Dysgonomonas sp. PH5-45]|uniref:DUF4269 domain-containing protein n=1 Tax=unclassified Dysgonomonas TaxID=2630389 RepID=UPI00247635FF|nr:MULTISPECIES: DUF4269 domain-containing protein [unclassified Dysgonomonas]MDH6353968.1 hypothetical protein [Dysgonomonas sp. PH5-45]MDH6386870.1 hypothetical protein [Dysgonomonas sp. PH5-37]